MSVREHLRRRGWVHALLLLMACMFLFPFVWMLATSMQTDEELVGGRLLPEWQTFRESSPYVRGVTAPIKPADVPAARWSEMLPQLRGVASALVAKQRAPEDHRKAASDVLVNSIVAQLDRSLWNGPDAALFNEFRSRASDDA